MKYTGDDSVFSQKTTEICLVNFLPVETDWLYISKRNQLLSAITANVISLSVDVGTDPQTVCGCARKGKRSSEGGDDRRLFFCFVFLPLVSGLVSPAGAHCAAPPADHGASPESPQAGKSKTDSLKRFMSAEI